MRPRPLPYSAMLPRQSRMLATIDRLERQIRAHMWERYEGYSLNRPYPGAALLHLRKPEGGRESILIDAGGNVSRYAEPVVFVDELMQAAE